MSTQASAAQKPLTIRLISTPDAERLQKLVVDVITALSFHIIKPIAWNTQTNQPLYTEGSQADFAVAILTPQYVEAASRGALWTGDSSARDTMYIWHETTPNSYGPWTKPGASGAVITHMTDEEARTTLREELACLVRTCDRCDNLCRGSGGLEYLDSKTGQVVKILCGRCVREDRVKDYRDNGIIDTHLMLDAVLDRYSNRQLLPTTVSLRINADIDRVREAIKDFETAVWFGANVQDYYQESNVRGHRLDPDEDVSVLMWGAAGRAMITFRHNTTGSYVTALCAEDSTTPTMKLEGINTTADEAVNLIKAAISAIKQDRRFQPDAGVMHIAVAIARAPQEETGE